MVFDLTRSIDFRVQGICAVNCRKHSQKTGTNSNVSYRILLFFAFSQEYLLKKPVYKVRQTCRHSLCDYQYQYSPTFTP